MISLLANPLIRAAGAALIAAALLGGAYIAGSRNAAQKARVQALEDFQATMERINETGIDTSDPDAVRRELCRIAGIAVCPMPGDETGAD